MSHFDLKSWATGGTKIWPNFLCQNDYFYLSAPREKIESFDLKSWVTGGIIIRPTFITGWLNSWIIESKHGLNQSIVQELAIKKDTKLIELQP